jgi:hypothetical protein
MSDIDINLLRTQIKNLQVENKVLTGRIKEIEGPFANKIEPSILIKSIQDDLLKVDEFAQAQERQTTYVVSDLNLQLKAVVSQEGSKPIFILPTKPGEIDPNLLSSVNITLKPIPHNVRPAITPRPVEAIEGIGPIIGGRLRKLGINNTIDLASATPEEVVKAGIPAKKATEFVKMARFLAKSELAGVENVDEQVAEVLVISGKIDSKEALAQVDPEELYKRIKKSIDAGKVKVPKNFALEKEDVNTWVNSARLRTGITKPE